MQKRQYIDGLFGEKSGSEVRKAHSEIVEMQKNKNKILRTNLPYIDNFLPDGLKNKMIFGGSRPAMGKTYNSSIIIENILDTSINPENVEILRFNWEMQTSSLLLRELKKSLGKSMKDIVSSEYTEEEKKIVKKTVFKLDDKRVTNVSQIIEGDDLRYLLDTFCTNKNPDHFKVVLVDHLHILTNKNRIDDFLSICNDMKLKYPNLCFVFYFQLNRTLETLWRGNNDNKANPKNFRPHSGHIYNTDAAQQYADLIYTLIIPQVANLDEYASVPREHYKHLEDHFEERSGSDSNWVRLKGRNRVYIDVIKVRLVDDFEDPRLFCELINPSREEEIQKKYKKTDAFSSTPPPKFNSQPENQYKDLPQLTPDDDIFETLNFNNGDEKDQDAPF